MLGRANAEQCKQSSGFSVTTILLSASTVLLPRLVWMHLKQMQIFVVFRYLGTNDSNHNHTSITCWKEHHNNTKFTFTDFGEGTVTRRIFLRISSEMPKKRLLQRSRTERALSQKPHTHTGGCDARVRAEGWVCFGSLKISLPFFSHSFATNRAEKTHKHTK